jgi:hypothetical protein
MADGRQADVPVEEERKERIWPVPKASGRDTSDVIRLYLDPLQLKFFAKVWSILLAKA